MACKKKKKKQFYHINKIDDSIIDRTIYLEALLQSLTHADQHHQSTITYQTLNKTLQNERPPLLTTKKAVSQVTKANAY